MRFGEILRLPLVEQCAELSIDCFETKLDYVGRPEQALLANYKSLGYVGVCCEGGGILTVLKALLLDELAEFGEFDMLDKCYEGFTCNYSNRDSARWSYLEGQFVSYHDKIDEAIVAIDKIPKSRFISNFKELVTDPGVLPQCPGLSVDFANAFFDAVGRKTFIKVAQKFAENPYTYRNGWPDLTLIKDSVICFIEVKTSDKLIESQIVTISAMKELLPFDFAVCKVIR